jgi:hypothetical protein
MKPARICIATLCLALPASIALAGSSPPVDLKSSIELASDPDH